MIILKIIDIDLFIPDMYQKSIYHINYDKLYEDGIRCLLFDLDNTMVPYGDLEPSSKLVDFVEELKDMGFRIIIFDDASKKRLLPFKNTLNVDCAYNAKKPNMDKFMKVIDNFKLDLPELAIIGDELRSDVFGGNRIGIKTILVNPISTSDSFKTKFYRRFERKIIAKLNKRGILIKGKYYE